MSSLAKARTGTARAARCAPAVERAVSLVKILLQTVARVAMFPIPLLRAGQPSAQGTGGGGGGECLWLNAARIFLSNGFHRARRRSLPAAGCALPSNDFHRA